MVRAGVDDGVIVSILTDPRWSISAHVLEQPHPIACAWRQIDQAAPRARAVRRRS
jgi:hypothetical protein